MRLYVLIDSSLPKVYGAVQGAHAVAQFLLTYPNTKWRNDTLVFLRCEDVNETFKELFYKAKKPVFASWYEPDMDNRMTAFAATGIDNLVKHLPLL